MHEVRIFLGGDGPYLFRISIDGIIQRCIPEMEMMSILKAFHSSLVGSYHDGTRIA